MTDTMPVRHYSRLVRSPGGLVTREIACGAVCEPETTNASDVHGCDVCGKWFRQYPEEALYQIEYLAYFEAAEGRLGLSERGVREAKGKLRELVTMLPLARE